MILQTVPFLGRSCCWKYLYSLKGKFQLYVLVSIFESVIFHFFSFNLQVNNCGLQLVIQTSSITDKSKPVIVTFSLIVMSINVVAWHGQMGVLSESNCLFSSDSVTFSIISDSLLVIYFIPLRVHEVKTWACPTILCHKLCFSMWFFLFMLPSMFLFLLYLWSFLQGGFFFI